MLKEGTILVAGKVRTKPRIELIENIYDLAVNGIFPSGYKIMEEAKNVFESVKVVQINRTIVRIAEEGPVCNIMELPEIVRAIAAYYKYLDGRQSDTPVSMQRLQEHYKLSISLVEWLKLMEAYQENITAFDEVTEKVVTYVRKTKGLLV